MDRILIVGIDSPLGRKLAINLRDRGLEVLGTFSRTTADPPVGVPAVPLPDPADEAAWPQLLATITHVIHLDDHAAFFTVPLKERLPDIAVTGRLAGAAAARRVKRFLYLSSVQAMTDHTLPGKPLAWRSVYQPANNYGRVKLESERLVARHCAPAKVEWQIVRPPEVYGPDLDSTIDTLVRLVRQRRFLTIPLLTNRLAFVHVDNLVEVMATAITHARGGNEALLVSDGDNIGTLELLRLIALALGRWLVILPLPLFLPRLFARSKNHIDFEPLIPLHSLAIDDSHTRQALDWLPLLNTGEGIKDLIRSQAGKG